MKTPAVLSLDRPTTALSIAFADDVPEIRELIREWLTAEGHRVMCVENGAELTRLWREVRFDIIISDVMMPEADGFEVVTALKQEQPDVRIIVISGGGSVMAAADCLRVAKRLGADAVLAKPFHRAQFLATIDRVASSIRGGQNV